MPRGSIAYMHGVSHPRIHQIVLKVASTCNLNCSYCYVYNHKDSGYLNRPALLSEEIARAALLRMREHCEFHASHKISICLHGGEPLLLGRARLRQLVDMVRSEMGPRLGALALQTNGVLIDREWARLLKDLRLNVGVSLDGARDAHDIVRVDHKGRGSHDRVLAGIRVLLDEGLNVSVLCVVQPGTSGRDAYSYLRGLGITSIDFLLPDVSHDEVGRRYGGLGPTPVADYLIPALDAWIEEDDPRVHVRLFADMFKLILGGSCGTDAFAGQETGYLVVETDGSIQANDALRVCEDGLNDTGLNVLDDGFDRLNDAAPRIRDVITAATPLATACRGCRESSTCGGGYLPHRYSRARGFDNPSVWCADILRMFTHVRSIVGRYEPMQQPELS